MIEKYYHDTQTENRTETLDEKEDTNHLTTVDSFEFIVLTLDWRLTDRLRCHYCL